MAIGKMTRRFVNASASASVQRLFRIFDVLYSTAQRTKGKGKEERGRWERERVGVGVGVSEECEFQFLTLLMRIASYSSALVHSLREECSKRMWQNGKRNFHVYLHLLKRLAFVFFF